MANASGDTGRPNNSLYLRRHIDKLSPAIGFDTQSLHLQASSRRADLIFSHHPDGTATRRKGWAINAHSMGEVRLGLLGCDFAKSSGWHTENSIYGSWMMK
jgi:hypothetical protein